MPYTPRQFGRRLRRLRTQQGRSKNALGIAAGISGEYVAKLEAGRSDPTVGVVYRLAKVLGVPVTALLE